MLKVFMAFDGDPWVLPLLNRTEGMDASLASAYKAAGLTGPVPRFSAIGDAGLVHDETGLSVDVIPNFAAILELGDCDLARIGTPFLRAWMSHILSWCRPHIPFITERTNIQLFVVGEKEGNRAIAGVGAYIATREIFGAWNCNLTVGTLL